MLDTVANSSTGRKRLASTPDDLTPSPQVEDIQEDLSYIDEPDEDIHDKK